MPRMEAEHGALVPYAFWRYHKRNVMEPDFPKGGKTEPFHVLSRLLGVWR